jgi:hypothetical protein
MTEQHQRNQPVCCLIKLGSNTKADQIDIARLVAFLSLLHHAEPYLLSLQLGNFIRTRHPSQTNDMIVAFVLVCVVNLLSCLDSC